MSNSSYNAIIESSKYIGRDLSWLKFNYRVLDQALAENRNVFEKLKFLAITASNLDEFFMIRVGSLYNYIDYNTERVDFSGLREIPFKNKLLEEIQKFAYDSKSLYKHHLKPLFESNGFQIVPLSALNEDEQGAASQYFDKTVHPMLTPMVCDSYHPFPILMNRVLTLGVVTHDPAEKKDTNKLSFVQIPKNLPRFYEVVRDGLVLFVPIEELIRFFIGRLFRNINILSTDVLRITRNGDFTLEESDEEDVDFLEELRRKLKTRRTGRVVRLEIEESPNPWLMKQVLERWDIGEDNIFRLDQDDVFDYTGFWYIVKHHEFKSRMRPMPQAVPPISMPQGGTENIFELLKERDILLHHPYNNMEPLLELLEQAAEDPNTLSIKLTIYRLASDSRIASALLKAAENGKHVSVLFEVKARFDEENNMREAKRLQKAGCFVIYGVSTYKTHTKLLLIVRKEGEGVTRYVHMSSGNYNESTAKLYTDTGIMSTNEAYAEDISEFFNVITGHSLPTGYKNLITAPRDMRQKLAERIRQEAENARNGLPSGIMIKINSLQDKKTIDELYAASQAGVPIRLVVRGMCCLRPGRQGLSDNIEVRSIVGELLEHSRIYYFHNNNDPMVYGGSADVMVRSFDRRLESLFLITDDLLKRQTINILRFNLMDNLNAYIMNEDGNYFKKIATEEAPFNIHEQFYHVTQEDIKDVQLF